MTTVLGKQYNVFILLIFYWTQHLTSAAASQSAARCNVINAAFHLPLDGSTYLLSADEYIEYNFLLGSEAKVGPITRLGLDENQANIDAAFDLGDDLYLLKGCRYFRYSISSRRRRFLVADGEGSLTQLGLPCNVSAALRLGTDTLAFNGCDVWKFNVTRAIFESHGTLGDHNLPCDLDAAVQWGGAGAIFIKGTLYWKFNGGAQGPYSTDDLHLCSWRLCGEADWMEERQRVGNLRCNGDRRFCQLRLDQVTLAGLHNAGAGFAGGFGLFNCWMRNHGLSITQQLELGIRHLDIDPCWDRCGLLGTCHSFSCGGSICHIIKEVRNFLRDNRDQVLTINFNHEITEPDKVFKALNRQLQTQLGPILNPRFRRSGGRRWPTLRRSIRANQRVFVIYAPIIEHQPHSRFYNRFKWIHSESLYGSTWRPFSVSSGCEQVVNLTATRCEVRQYRELVEVAIIPESSGSCVETMARTCLPYLHQALRACQPYRFRHQRSPNVLLVDYPERSQAPASVFSAVFHQNLRNLRHHRRLSCQVELKAAVWLSNTALFFTSQKLIMYSHQHQAQIGERPLDSLIPDLPVLDAAYLDPDSGHIRLVAGCEWWELDSSNDNSDYNDDFEVVSLASSPVDNCHMIQAASVWQGELWTVAGCQATGEANQTISLTTDWGLPCDLDAVMSSDDDTLYLFKGDDYWVYRGGEEGRRPIWIGNTLDWNIDVLRCT